MITFRIAPSTTRGVECVECREGDTLVAVIYPHDDGLHVVSKFMGGVMWSDGPPKSVLMEVKLMEGPSR